MNALKKIIKFMKKQPDSETSRLLSGLIQELDKDGVLKFSDLYQLDYDNFNHALELMREWRLRRYEKKQNKLRGLADEILRQETVLVPVSEVADKLNKTDKADKVDKTDKTDKAEKLEKVEKSSKTEKSKKK